MQSPTTLQPYDVDGVIYYNGHHGDDPEDDGSIRGPSVDEEDEDDDDISTASGGRHGNLLRPEPEDYIVTESPYMTHWFSKRHLTGGNPKPRSPSRRARLRATPLPPPHGRRAHTWVSEFTVRLARRA